MDITKIYISLYKLKKCLLWQFRGINIMATIIIMLLLALNIFQQLYYPRIIEQDRAAYDRHIEYLRLSFDNVSNGMEDVQKKVEDYNANDWKENISQIRLLMDALDVKISYFSSSINNYYSPGRAKKQRLIF